MIFKDYCKIYSVISSIVSINPKFQYLEDMSCNENLDSIRFKIMADGIIDIALCDIIEKFFIENKIIYVRYRKRGFIINDFNSLNILKNRYNESTMNELYNIYFNS